MCSYTFFYFLAITSFLNINKNLISVSILFIANLMEIFYSVVYKLILIFQPMYIISLKKILYFIVFVVFVVFWVRRFGEAFTIFPIIVVVNMYMFY